MQPATEAKPQPAAWRARIDSPRSIPRIDLTRSMLTLKECCWWTPSKILFRQHQPDGTNSVISSHWLRSKVERASSECGILSLSASAVSRLMTVSNLLGSMTGSSAGFAPSRMRPT
jgi:Cft2 family RNA processing exonuclease